MFDNSNLGKISNLTNIFQMGWNHQLVMFINHPPRDDRHVRCLVSSPSLTALDLHRCPCDTTAAAGHATVSRPGDFGQSWGGQFGGIEVEGLGGIEVFCWVLGVKSCWVELVGFGFGRLEKRSGKSQWSYLIWYGKNLSRPIIWSDLLLSFDAEESAEQRLLKLRFIRFREYHHGDCC